MIQQHEWQRQCQSQIGKQRSSQEDAMETKMSHNRVTVFPYAPRGYGRISTISSRGVASHSPESLRIVPRTSARSHRTLAIPIQSTFPVGP